MLIVSILGPIESTFCNQSMQAVSSEPEIHMNVYNSSAWVRDSWDRPVAKYWLNIVVWNSGNATAYSAGVDFSLLKYGYVVENGSLSVGNMGKGESWNTTKMFELNEGYYEINLTLETPGKIWQTVTDAYQVSFPRSWCGDYARLYVTPRDPVIQSMVNSIGKDAGSLYIWVGDKIRYVYDNVSHGVGDYWQLPYETLNLTTGDCEDVAFLLCSLMRAAGVSAEDVFVAMGTADGGWHAWVIQRTATGWRSLEPTVNGFIERLLVDIFDFFGIPDRKYYQASNDLYFEQINISTNQPYVYQTFWGWYVNGIGLQGDRVTVEKGQLVTLLINVANPGFYTYAGFIKIEIDKYVALGFDYAFTSTNYSLTLYPGESTSLPLTFNPDEVTGNSWGQCTHYYYKVYTCFACIHQPPDADTRECVYVLSSILRAPDVAIMNLSPFKTLVGLGYSVNISAVAANQGDYSETCNVTVYANSTQVERQPVTLETGTSTNMTFTWNTSRLTYGNYIIYASAWPVPGETDTSDNNCTCNITIHVGVPGDISGPTLGVYDGKCDMRDVSYLIIRFNSNPNSANWNANADINNDATVNMRDVSIAILNFNKHE